MKIKLPVSGETLTKTMLLTQKHKSIEMLFDKNFWKSFLGCPSVKVRKKQRKFAGFKKSVNKVSTRATNCQSF